MQANTGRAAIARGPLVYCIESADHRQVDLDSLVLRPDSELRAVEEPEVLGGLTAIRGSAGVAFQHQSDKLYARFDGRKAEVSGSTALTAIPYFVWANRAPGAMRVWIPYVDN